MFDGHDDVGLIHDGEYGMGNELKVVGMVMGDKLEMVGGL